jgi:hypothetical protein
VDSTLHDIVNGVMIANVQVELMADAQPQYAKSLKKFSAALERLQKEVLANVLSERKDAKKRSS